MTVIQIGTKYKNNQTFIIIENNRKETFSATKSQLKSIRDTIDIMINNLNV